MKRCIVFICLFSAMRSSGQKPLPLSVIDFVKIVGNNRAEALYYYENNWKPYRDVAVKEGYIQSYKLLTTKGDSAANFDIILITEYADSAQLKKSELHFQQIIKELRPDGPKLLNALKPEDFRANLFSKIAECLY